MHLLTASMLMDKFMVQIEPGLKTVSSISNDEIKSRYQRLNKLFDEVDVLIPSEVENKNQQLINNIRTLMKQHGEMTESKLAKEINLPQPTVNRLLSGAIADPKISTLTLIANFFKISIDWLLGRNTAHVKEFKEDEQCNELNASDISNRHLKKIQLTKREREVLVYLSSGYTAKQIARTLYISPRTVESYLDNLKYKFRVRSKSELINEVLTYLNEKSA